MFSSIHALSFYFVGKNLLKHKFYLVFVACAFGVVLPPTGQLAQLTQLQDQRKSLESATDISGLVDMGILLV